MPRNAHHKIRLASFIHPNSVSIVSPRGAFLALRVAPLSHELHAVAGIRRANSSPAIVRRARYHPSTTLAAGIAAVVAAPQGNSTPPPLSHQDSSFFLPPD